MTTKPKARKFRVKRSPPRPGAEQQDVRAAAPEPSGAATARNLDDPTPTQAQARPARKTDPVELGAHEPLKSSSRQPRNPAQQAPSEAPQPRAEAAQTRKGSVDSAQQVAAETDLDSIRREGLTGRQLRMARRVAQKHGLAPTSDFDAVRLLRKQGIDPFQRSNMLELVVPDQSGAKTQPADVNDKDVKLPQTVPAGKETLPSTETAPPEQLSPAQRREREISDIQRDIMRRRRKKMGLLLTRLAFFVMLPTFLAGWYFYVIATPMFATDSEFLIIQNEGSGGAGPLGGLLPTQFATGQDSIAVQSYLTSKDAMLRLDRETGFKAHFTESTVDPIQRLSKDATNEEAYKLYKKNVKIGFDPTEGVIRMEVIAADPAVSQSFSEALISYAEERVNQLSVQKREDQMRDALAALEKAEVDRRGAQGELVELQIEGATLDPEAVIAGLRAQITEINTLITQKEIELETLLNNARPNRAKVDGARSTLLILGRQRDQLESEMTDMSRGENSLAQLSINIQMAQADLATRDMMLQSALQQLEQARVEANRQVRYLTVAVRPVAPEEAAYPRAFENTILAFLIFAGIYLMISLTASILREQVSS